MYLGYQNEKVKFYTEQPLDETFYNLDKVEETQDEYALDGDCYVLKDEVWEEKQAQKEAERIRALSMTRSDFFDGTIKAFSATQEKLKIAIESILANLEISEIDKTIAMNNYDNALNFYRKHPLFDLLSGVSISVSEMHAIVIKADQWDKFFDETDKKNPDAYKALLPSQEMNFEE